MTFCIVGMSLNRIPFGARWSSHDCSEGHHLYLWHDSYIHEHCQMARSFELSPNAVYSVLLGIMERDKKKVAMSFPFRPLRWKIAILVFLLMDTKTTPVHWPIFTCSCWTFCLWGSRLHRPVIFSFPSFFDLCFVGVGHCFGQDTRLALKVCTYFTSEFIWTTPTRFCD